MIFTIDRNEIKVESTQKGLRLTTNSDSNLLLAHVSDEEIKTIVTKNYNFVKNYFIQRTGDKISNQDLERIALKIVLHYFYLYQNWRGIYENEKDRDLSFIQSDFGHPQTADLIVWYFKTRHPNNYAEKCCLMLNMSCAGFKEYEASRQAFFNR